MFKRLFNMFKRDETKKVEARSVTMEMPAPKKEVKTGRQYGWVDRLVQRATSFKLQRQIRKGLHIARPRGVHKPLKMDFKRTDFSKSADLHIDRLKGRVPNRKAERVELGILNANK
ncbi:MAG: hypothetical protein IMZ53_00415 [Thermoplasmata archaeon]|nr:hypothetical protein [Thermoplasmata archaeon]